MYVVCVCVCIVCVISRPSTYICDPFPLSFFLLPSSFFNVLRYLVRALRSSPVRLIACGAEHTLVVLAKGDVLSWGSSDEGALGLGPSVLSAREPQLMNGVGAGVNQLITEISANQGHSAMLTAAGMCLVFGR